jgi:hypothetical protein
MQVTQGRTLDAGRRVQGFLDTQAANIGTSVSASLRAKLDAAVQQLTAAGLAQETASGNAKAATVNQTVLRKALYDGFLVHIGRVAKASPTLKGSGDAAVLFVKADDERSADFIAKASAAADAAERHQQEFVDHGMAADFVTQLRAAIAQIVAAKVTQQTQAANRTKASGDLKTADTAVRQSIGFVDAALKPVLKKDPALKAGWEASKLIHSTTVSPLPTGNTAVPSSTTPTVPPATPPAAA